MPQLTVPRVRRPGPAGAASRPAEDLVVWVLRGLSCLYAVLAVVQVSQPHAGAVLGAAAAGSALVLGAAALWCGRRLRAGRPVPPVVEIYAFVPVTNSLLRLLVLHDVRYTTALMLVFVGLAVVIRSRLVVASALLAGGIGWVVLVVTGGLAGPNTAHDGIQLAVAAAMACLIRGGLRRREQRLGLVQDELARSADQFTRIFMDSPVGMGMSDAEGLLVAVNPAFCRLVGRPAQDLLGLSDLGYTHEDDRGGHATTGSQIAAAPDRVAHIEKRYMRPDGSVRWAWLSLTHVQAPPGTAGPWTLAHVQDVTDRHDAEQALRDSERNLTTVTSVARRVRQGHDARTTIVQAVQELAAADTVTLIEPEETGAALVVTAARGADLVGTRIPLTTTSMTVQVYRSGLPVFLADTGADPVVSPRLLALSGARSMMWQPVVAGDGTTAVLAVGWTCPVPSQADRRPQAVTVLADETALALDHERLIRRLQELAETDQLTGLVNRRGWDARLATLMAQVRRGRRPLTVAIADLDHFKRFNDLHGHPAGDALLRRTGEAFAGVLREGDLVARWGGEEFAFALPDCAAEDAELLLDRLRLAVPDGQTCSIGYTVWDRLQSPAALVEQADIALYEAKQTGRNRIRAGTTLPTFG